MKCNFEKLWMYWNNSLDPDTQMEVLEHIACCEICYDAACQIARDQNSDLCGDFDLTERLAG